jgi:hypothetical protein
MAEWFKAAVLKTNGNSLVGMRDYNLFSVIQDTYPKNHYTASHRFILVNTLPLPSDFQNSSKRSFPTLTTVLAGERVYPPARFHSLSFT